MTPPESLRVDPWYDDLRSARIPSLSDEGSWLALRWLATTAVATVAAAVFALAG